MQDQNALILKAYKTKFKNTSLTILSDRKDGFNNLFEQ
jgi:hypothetical protein